MGYFKRTEKTLRRLMGEDPVRTRSIYPGMQLGLANRVMGSRMPGSSEYERNLFSNQAGYLDRVQRNATDSSSAISAAAAGLGSTNNSLADFASNQADWKKYGLGLLGEAYGANQQEDELMNQDQVRRYQDKVELEGAIAANQYAKRRALWDTVSGIANFGLGVANVATGGKGLKFGAGSKSSGPGGISAYGRRGGGYTHE